MPLLKRPSTPPVGWAAWIPGFLLLLSAATGHAEDAKAHYQKATAHFAVGEYHDAAIEYEEAFKLKQDPAILFNAAQSFRLAGENQKALLLYNNIVKLYPGSQYAKDSKERIQKLAESGTSPPAAMPPAEPPPVAPPVAAIAPAPIAPAPAVAAPGLAAAPSGGPAVVVSSPPASAEDHPIYKRWWFWTGVGVVVVGAVVAGIALSSGGTTSTPWNNLPPVQGGLR
jgi:tetratricopeptide (TPR) repeat protein